MLTLRHILNLVVISVVFCNLENVTKKLNTGGSVSLKAEKTKALDKFVDGKVQNKTSTRSRQEILSPEYDCELEDKNNHDQNEMKDWILCQKVNWEPSKELCKYCVVCNNVLPVKTGFNVEKNETFVIGVDDNDNDNEDDYDYLNLNINKKRRVTKSQFRPRPKPRPRPRPRPIRRGHKKEPEFKKAISTPTGIEGDDSDIEKREKQMMTILKNAFHEKRISLKEYLTMLNNLVFLSNKASLKMSESLTLKRSLDDFDSDHKRKVSDTKVVTANNDSDMVKDINSPDTNDVKNNDNETMILN